MRNLHSLRFIFANINFPAELTPEFMSPKCTLFYGTLFSLEAHNFANLVNFYGQ